MDVSEKNLEASIESVLVGDKTGAKSIREPRAPYGEFTPGGYSKRNPDEYDRARCLIPADVLDFVYATQPKEWEKYKKHHGSSSKDSLFQRLAHEVQSRGTLDVLRKGIKADGCKFQLAYFRPSSNLNAEVRLLYEANVFSVVRQLKYSQKTEHSLDLVLLLNGLPVFTAELKNSFTGQTVVHAIGQYRTDRDPREPLFAFGRCLAHFAIDPDLVYMSTRLEGPTTRFLPFNRGRDFGAGNSPSADGFATAYLWERVWSRDSVLDLIQNFVQTVEEENEQGKKTGACYLIFPRYHQLDAVRRMVADARVAGTGQRYLIQHSARSGKSNSIAWLAHQLATLHGPSDSRVFDSIIIVTDRRVLDRQLQRAVSQFQQTLGVVENIDQTSRQLKTALEDGKTIIVTTLQKFPVIVTEIGTLPGRRFAVIIDEAHSSQSGESAKHLNQVLTVDDLEEAEQEEAGEPEDIEDTIAGEMKARGHLPNVSYFAFTATPKNKTLELFGSKQPNGKFAPFSLYTMRQAIEEGFILDVLRNYTTYKTYFGLLKKVENDPKYDRAKAKALLMWFVGLDKHMIDRKVAIIVEHFAEHCAAKIGGKAKAMIVTRSRLHAVRYRQALEAYLAKMGYPFEVLVAFSGTVKDGGLDYTEPGMNGFSERQTAETFKRDRYRFLVVANKFQTGFDQPLLHTMYVDKKLAGVNAVQTLSRLNRVHPEKIDTMVLDFANEADDIQKAFEPYYDRLLLSEATDPNLLYDLETQLNGYHYFGTDDADAFASHWYDPKGTQSKLHTLLAPVVDRYLAAAQEERSGFRGCLTEYLRLYAFLSQVISFVDTGLEKLYVFGRLLLRKLPAEKDRLPLEIQDQTAIESIHLQKVTIGNIKLSRGAHEVAPVKPQNEQTVMPEEIEALSQIIEDLNQQFGTDFSSDDKVIIQHLEIKLAGNESLFNSVRVNTVDNARLTFRNVVTDQLQELADTNFRFYKKVTDDQEFADVFLEALFERYRKRVHSQDVAKSA